MAKITFEGVKQLIEQAFQHNWEIFRLDTYGITELPEEIGKLRNLQGLFLAGNDIAFLPSSIGNLSNLKELDLSFNQLETIPESFGNLSNLQKLNLTQNHLKNLPNSIGKLKSLTELSVKHNRITSLPEDFGGMVGLTTLNIEQNKLSDLPSSIGRMINLEIISGQGNKFVRLPASLVNLKNLKILDVRVSSANPALFSAYNRGLKYLLSYLRSLALSKPLYEAKLVLVGEGKVGKTTLLKALTGKNPQEDELTTHGVSINIDSLQLAHPNLKDTMIQFNAWDFGGQEVYRVTHQFFFSRRSIYLVVWEPRLGVQQSQVEDWLKLIRLRVGDDARVIIVSTHAKTGKRIARIDKPVFMRDYGTMIVDFVEVDSLVDDPELGNEKYNIPKLKSIIADAAKGLEQMGIEFNVNWKNARDALVQLGQTKPRVSYNEFLGVCKTYHLDGNETITLAVLMHDLGYIVYYNDDERLKDDVVLQPEWLTKAIGFVLEDRKTQELDGILFDNHLKYIWWDNPADEVTRFDSSLYPFFLRLMEKHDVSYRLPSGDASLVAQHVPQVRPSLPWTQDDEKKSTQKRHLSIICMMNETPPGLIPWMIVRTHDYATEYKNHRLHWQKGMFLQYKEFGEALLELREREFHIAVNADDYPEFFCNILRQTLQKLITDNWPGMDGHYHFAVPCKSRVSGLPCQGRFRIDALSKFIKNGLREIPCQVCYEPQNILELLYGFEDENPRDQLAHIESEMRLGFDVLREKLEGLDSRVANYVMSIMLAMANEAKDGPRLFDIHPISSNWLRLDQARYKLHLWCEAEGCQHPITESGKGVYEFSSSKAWVKKIAPYAIFVSGVLKTLLPLVAPTINIIFGNKTFENLGVSDHLDLMEGLTDALSSELKLRKSNPSQAIISDKERSGLLAFHALLRELDPYQYKLGLRRMPTYTGDYLWLCEKHYDQIQPKIPEKIG